MPAGKLTHAHEEPHRIKLGNAARAHTLVVEKSKLAKARRDYEKAKGSYDPTGQKAANRKQNEQSHDAMQTFKELRELFRGLAMTMRTFLLQQVDNDTMSFIIVDHFRTADMAKMDNFLSLLRLRPLSQWAAPTVGGKDRSSGVNGKYKRKRFIDISDNAYTKEILRQISATGDVHHVKGDGNCMFSALSYLDMDLTTGKIMGVEDPDNLRTDVYTGLDAIWDHLCVHDNKRTTYGQLVGSGMTKQQFFNQYRAPGVA